MAARLDGPVKLVEVEILHEGVTADWSAVVFNTELLLARETEVVKMGVILDLAALTARPSTPLGMAHKLRQQHLVFL